MGVARRQGISISIYLYIYIYICEQLTALYRQLLDQIPTLSV